MNKWMAGLKGSKYIMDGLSLLLNSELVKVYQEGEKYYIILKETNNLDDENDVQQYLVDFLPTLNGVGKAALDGYENVELSGEIVRVQADGTRSVFHYFSVSTTLFVRGSAVVEESMSPNHPTDAEVWLSESIKNPEVSKLLQLFSAANSWATLSVVLDYIEQDVGKGEKPLLEKGIIAPEDAANLKRFTGTANNFNVLGLSARHGYPKWKPPSNPMTFDEANITIRNVVTKWLRWKSTS